MVAFAMELIQDLNVPEAKARMKVVLRSFLAFLVVAFPLHLFLLALTLWHRVRMLTDLARH